MKTPPPADAKFLRYENKKFYSLFKRKHYCQLAEVVSYYRDGGVGKIIEKATGRDITKAMIARWLGQKITDDLEGAEMSDLVDLLKATTTEMPKMHQAMSAKARKSHGERRDSMQAETRKRIMQENKGSGTQDGWSLNKLRKFYNLPERKEGEWDEDLRRRC